MHQYSWVIPFPLGKGKAVAAGGLGMLLYIFLALTVNANAGNLYVARDGNDRWSGHRAAPNARRTDGPFATLEGARDAVRALKKRGRLPAGGVTVWIRGGLYPRTQTFALTAEDSGTPSAPIVYRAYRNETVRLVGGREVGGWQPVSDPSILARLDPAARSHVLQADLKAQGIAEFGQMRRRGFGQAIVPAGLELFFEDRPMTLARWPNDGWAHVAGTPGGSQGGRFTYTGDRPQRWKTADDVWLHGYWTWDWADSYEKVQSIDTASHTIFTEPPHGIYGYTPGKRFYALNLLEELDSPGEWYLDRKTGLLYFWPPAPLISSRAVVSLLETPMVTLTDTANVTLRDLTFECSRGSGVEIAGGAHNLVAGCTLRNLGTFAVRIGNGPGDTHPAASTGVAHARAAGAGNGVAGCDIYQTGDGAIQLDGGDRRTLTPGGNFAVNNHLYDYSRWSFTYRPGVLVDGVGNRVAHNSIHDAPHTAILLSGNDHIIEYNEIYRVCLQTGDAGAFYMGRDFTMRGNIVRYNYFHDIARNLEGSSFVDVMSVYLDDCASGTTVYGNIFYRGGRAAMIGGGRDNTIENNIFVDCAPAIHVDGRGLGWAKFWFDGRDPTLMDRLKAMNFTAPPYSTRYPHLANILADDPAVPKYNRIARNICVGTNWIEWLDGINDKVVEVRDNLTAGDPRFVSLQKRDFRLKPDSPALKLGFQSIPIQKIGLYRDPYRPQLPTPSSTRSHQ